MSNLLEHFLDAKYFGTAFTDTDFLSDPVFLAKRSFFSFLRSCVWSKVAASMVNLPPEKIKQAGTKFERYLSFEYFADLNYI